MNEAAAMSCPVCRVPLVMSERQGVEIDYCPQCRGVWLDRGELDKIIERAAADTQPAPGPAPAQAQPQQPYGRQGDYDRGYDRDRDRGYGHGDHHRHGRRRKSFLEELFD